jgi:hypothetical protein
MGSHVLVRGNPALKALDSRTWLSFFIIKPGETDVHIDTILNILGDCFC